MKYFKILYRDIVYFLVIFLSFLPTLKFEKK